MSYSDDIKINRFNLPEECSQHASKYHNIAELLANTKSDLSDAEDKLKLIMSEREQFYRMNWEDSRWGKLSEAAVKAKVESDEEVQDQKKKISELQRNVNVYGAAEKAFEHRKSMLNNLTSLLIGSFYAAPEGGRQETKSTDKERRLREQRRGMNNE